MAAVKPSAPLFESPTSIEDEGDILLSPDSNHIFNTENYLLRRQTSHMTKPEIMLMVEGITNIFLVDMGADITNGEQPVCDHKT